MEVKKVLLIPLDESLIKLLYSPELEKLQVLKFASVKNLNHH